MPDLLQPGPLLSLPLLHGAGEALEADLREWTRRRPLTLVLPCHVRDLEGAALEGMVATLADIPWVQHIVVGLDGAAGAAGDHAEAVFRPLGIGSRCTLVRRGNPPGKGRNLAACAGIALAREPGPFAVVMHDCDIASYSREFLARLCWPVLHPEAGLSVCKGAYARSASGLHGRVFRLLFQPLLRAWAELGPSPWTAFLQALRYPLSGELCVRSDVLQGLDFAAGWGVEVKLLHELFRNPGPAGICQAELCAAYDHKHQAPQNLIAMAAEVAAALEDSMVAEGCSVSTQALRAAFGVHSARAVRDSLLTARINGLPADAAAEQQLADAFFTAVFPPQGDSGS